MELINIVEGRIVTTSRMIAEKFGKRHSNVLQAIDNLEYSQEFIQLNFKFNEYTDPIGRKLREYYITKNGFACLVMGFTGKDAAEFKEQYINAFERMEAELNRPKELSRIEILELALNNEKEKLRLEGEVKRLEPKAKLYDKVMDDGRLYSVSEVAKVLKLKGLGRNKLYEQLRGWGLLFTNKNEPKQQYVDSGLFEVRFTWVEALDMKIPTVKVTNKGLRYISDKLNRSLTDFIQ